MQRLSSRCKNHIVTALLLWLGVVYVVFVQDAPAKSSKSGTTAAAGSSSSQAASAQLRSLSRTNPFPIMRYPIRVGIVRRESLARIAMWAPGALYVDGVPVFALEPQHVYDIYRGRITDLYTNSSYPLPSSRRSLIASIDHRIWAANRWYRGVLEIVNYGSSITVINVLDLEEYLLGVVPSEMPATWQREALMAQAVAARSYATAHRGPGLSKWMSTEGYDLVPDVRDQVYHGMAVETNASNYAVRATMGIVLRDAGRVKAGFYRAWVGDSYENLNIRKQTIPGSYLESITGVPHVVGVTVKKFYPNGNALSVQIIGAKKSREVDGIVLAHMLSLSTPGILDVEPSGGDWVFTCRGPGNGVRGMSQHGANMFAERGWKYMQILQQYYQDPSGHLQLTVLPEYARCARIVQPPRAASSDSGSSDKSSSE
jgi:stage II sporulation protein D